MKRPRTKWLVVAALAVSCVSCCILAPCPFRTRDENYYWHRARHDLHLVAAAVRTYHARHGNLPPAVVRDREGRPLYSWRVLLLQYIDGPDARKNFRLDEPWDSPHNHHLSALDDAYRSGRRDPSGTTRFQVFVGPGTAFERDGLTWDDFPDGPANTILIAEARRDPVPSSSPADLAYRPDAPLPPLGGQFAEPVKFACFTIAERPGFNVVYADGSIGFIKNTTDERTIRALITRNGGEAVTAPKW